MPEKLQLYVCEHFKIETLSVLEFIETNDVEPLFFPIRCGRPIQTNKKFSSLSIFDKNLTDSKSICACSCLLEEDKEFLDNNNIEKLYLDNCFQMFAPKSIINKLINEGAYIITPGWLSKWRVWVKQWGKKEHIKDMFSETISKLVLLDTGNDPNSSLNLKDFSEYLNIHSETIDVGLDFFKLYLENEILKWRLSLKNQNNQDNKTKIQSDYAMALDLLAHLPRAEKEEVLANRIMEVFVMMFAANKITYLSIVDSKPLNSWSIPDGLNTTNCIDKKSNLADPISRTKSDKGFCIRIGSKENTLAIIELDDITFPENIVEYQNLALDMSEVIALSIENSRYFQKLLEMNKTLKSLNLTKDKLFSIIAHDLRSPFGHILNISELLIDKTDDLSNDKLKLYSNIIYTSAQRTLVLLDNLLNWAKSQTGQLSNNPKSQSLNPLIEETTEFLIPNALSKGIRLNYIATE
ncbi:MAG: hypothetical protein C0598_03560 [Marinilabiliales bacterium]|nr:MAG: hypothetical protein C0598_03560 [Marinilabiliales bacterium]